MLENFFIIASPSNDDKNYKMSNRKSWLYEKILERHSSTISRA